MQLIVIVLVMAVVQGIAEFIPISSSGHLLVLSHFFFPADYALDSRELVTLGVMLHAGTLMSIVVVFRKLIVRTVFHDPRLLTLVVTVSIPTAIAGLVIRHYLYTLQTNLTFTAAGFLITAFFLFSVVAPADRKRLGRKKPAADSVDAMADRLFDCRQTPDVGTAEKETPDPYAKLSYLDAFVIGCFQGFGVFPGISRSGITIAASLLCGLPRQAAAGFSFLVAVPAILGAIVLELRPFVTTHDPTQYAMFRENAALFAAATLLSFAVGLVSLRLLLRWLEQGRLHYWGFWLAILAVVLFTQG